MTEPLKHTWKSDEDGNIDIFAAENLGHNYCNGPKCEVCGFEFCHHCSRDGYDYNCPGYDKVAADRQAQLISDFAIHGVAYTYKGERIDPRDVKPWTPDESGG